MRSRLPNSSRGNRIDPSHQRLKHALVPPPRSGSKSMSELQLDRRSVISVQKLPGERFLEEVSAAFYARNLYRSRQSWSSSPNDKASVPLRLSASTTSAGSIEWARTAQSEPLRYLYSAARLGKTALTTSWKSPASTAAYRTAGDGRISASTRSSSGKGTLIRRNFTAEYGAPSPDLGALPNPARWIDLSDLLDLLIHVSENSRVGGLTSKQWTLAKLEVLPIRNKIQHMRLPSEGDKRTIEKHIRAITR